MQYTVKLCRARLFAYNFYILSDLPSSPSLASYIYPVMKRSTRTPRFQIQGQLAESSSKGAIMRAPRSINSDRPTVQVRAANFVMIPAG